MAAKVRHLLERDGRYFARLVIPTVLRLYMDEKTELRTPLGGDRRQALKNLPGAVAGLQHRIGIAEAKHAAMIGSREVAARYPMSADRLALRQYHQLVDFDSEMRRNDDRFATGEVDEGDAADLRAGMSGKLSDDALDRLVGYRIDRFRARGNTNAQKGTIEWRDLAIKLCVSEYEALSRHVERNDGDFTGAPSHPLLAGSDADDVRSPVLITGLLDSYLKELERGGKGAAARQRWTPTFASLVAFIKHDDATRLTKGNILEWKEHLSATLAARTIRDVHLASLRAVLNWAVQNDCIAVNPTAGVKVKVVKAQRLREKGFRDDEALTILKTCKAYTPPRKESAQIAAAKRWTSLLCAFTGARITEVTQLRKDDVRSENGVTIIRITPEAGSVKTGNYRDVPLHRQIIEEGFMDFVDAAPAGPLFHKSKPDKALIGARTASGRVSNWLQAEGVIPDGVSPNHGWRHRLKTVGQELEISDRVIDAIQGHAGRTAGDDYGDVTIAAKSRALERLPSYSLK